jgi:hypothetical protein
MANDIKQWVEQCPECLTTAPIPRDEPFLKSEAPAHPMAVVAVDFMQHAGQTRLIMADWYSGWIWISQPMRSTTVETTIKVLTEWFQETRWPYSIRSDGGPQF